MRIGHIGQDARRLPVHGAQAGTETEAAQPRACTPRLSADSLPRPPASALPPSGSPAVAICTLVRDEARALREWLHHHAAVGVSRFFVYDDNSTDATAAVLAPYERIGVVTRVAWPSPAAMQRGVVCDGGASGAYSYCQTSALNDCLARAAAGAMAPGDWVAFVDTDEMLLPRIPAALSVQQALAHYDSTR